MYFCLKYIFNIRNIKVLKLINNIDIIIENNKQRLEKCFFSNFKKNNKDDNLKLSIKNNNTFFVFITNILLNKIINITDYNNFIK